MTEDNPFEDAEVARLYSVSVENETGSFRDNYIYPKLKDWLVGVKGKRVLDVGSGQGVASQFIADKYYVGIEPSVALLERAQKNYPDKEFIKGDVYDIPFPGKSFGGVFVITVWFHLENIKKASFELARVLKPGGRFLIIDPNPDSRDIWHSFYKEIKERKDNMIRGKVQIPHVVLPDNTFYLHTKDEVVAALNKAELEVIETKSFIPMEDFDNRDLFKLYSGFKK